MSNEVNLGPLLNRLADSKLLINLLSDKIVADVNPFVPVLNGDLQNSIHRINRVGGTTLIWEEPYARYVYNGKAMAYPNGTPKGWNAKKGYKKVVTGKPLHYTHDEHPQARKQWVDHAWLLNGQNWEALVMHGLGAS